MQEISLLIMAAGMGSRFGGGVKQMEAVGPFGETIMDYSIHDAIEAGFSKIVFVIRKDMEAAFKSTIGNRIERNCARLGVAVGYAYQRTYGLPEGRAKPWGTGQAVLSAKMLICEPFAVINADDYYGKAAFRQVYGFLTAHRCKNEFCMAGFALKNTLSGHGSVTRGLCRVEDGMLADIVETMNIEKTPDGASAGGIALDPDTWVSMNMWGLAPEFMDVLGEKFEGFLETRAKAMPLTAEFMLPEVIGEELRQGRCSVKVLPTADRWFGMTYKADMETVKEAFRGLIDNGVYHLDLYSDL